jgi:maleylpyruvate isomerase
LNADTQPLQNLWVLKKIEEIAKDGAKAKDEWARFVVAKGLASFEADVQSTAGTRCIGDELTIADLFLVPQLGTARRFGVDMAAFPTLLRIEAEMLQLPAFKAAHPDQQPDKA